MSKKVLSFLRSNAIALVALTVALGGVSYAAVHLPKNSVGKKQIKKNAIVSAKVKNKSLLKKDFKSGQLPKGAVGPTGPTGSVGIAEAGKVSNVTQRGAEFGFDQTNTSFLLEGSVTLNAPADGFVLVDGSGSFHTNTAITGKCGIEAKIRHDGTLSSGSAVTSFTAGEPTLSYRNMGLSEAFPVTAGSQTFEYVMRVNSNVSPSCTGTWGVPNPRMTALWVPHDGD